MSDLRRAIGSLKESEFNKAAEFYKKEHRIHARNLEVAKDFLVLGKLQIVIAEERNITKQLVHKQCKRLFDAYLMSSKINKS